MDTIHSIGEPPDGRLQNMYGLAEAAGHRNYVTRASV